MPASPSSACSASHSLPDPASRTVAHEGPWPRRRRRQRAFPRARESDSRRSSRRRLPDPLWLRLGRHHPWPSLHETAAATGCRTGGAMPWDSGRQIWIPGEQIWLPIFQELAPDFPAPGSSRAQWGHFALSCGSWPGVLLALGAAVVLWVLCQSCMIEEEQTRAALLAASVAEDDVRPEPAGGGGGRGGSCHVRLHVGGRHGPPWRRRHGRRAARGRPALGRLGDRARPRRTRARLPRCRAAARRGVCALREREPVRLRPAGAAVRGHCSAGDRIGAVKSTTAGFRRLVLLGLLVPLGLMVACVLALAAAARLSRRSWKAGCCMHCLVPAFLAPAALAAAAAAAAQLELGVALGSFCENRDSNMVDYVSYLEGNESTMALLVSFYVSSNASGVNPLLDYQRGAAANATALGDSVDALLREDAGSGNITTLCPRWSGATA
ncbi:unnamed protein product [Prorocentrum cordatum]|uniref:Uncharacterized protein n=1 Tax=Prorocentrum cordatum TaxID=2364126 RepID=A0ABN9YEV1_9DINO|nr:unnamed protein product [Polarella glacialis]